MTELANVVENFVKEQDVAPTEMRGQLSPLKLVPHFLSQKECKFFINLVSPQSTERIQQLSSRKRLIYDSEIVAKWFWDRFQTYNPFEKVTDEHGDVWTPVGANSRFRLVRYDKGDQFKTHEDGFYWESWKRKTFATAMVYLNDMEKEDGGATNFHHIRTIVHPAQGLLVVFLVDNLDHCGEPCNKEKYLLRTDIMYELTVPLENSEEFIKTRKELFKEFKRYDD